MKFLKNPIFNYLVTKRDSRSWAKICPKRQSIFNFSELYHLLYNDYFNYVSIVIQHILEREEIWNKWKNEGCQNFVKEKRAAISQAIQKPKRVKPSTSDFITNQNSKGFLSENMDVISKLCNVNHGNLEACKDPNRQFLPSLKEFFEEAKAT